jgi:HSP20 family protein
MRGMLTSFLDLVHLRAEMNRLFESLQNLQCPEEVPDSGSSTPYDILETPEHIVVEVDLPGVNPESIKIQARGVLVTSHGERSRATHSGIIAYHLMERDRGGFTRTITVDGALDTHRATADYRKGVLTIKFPRLPERRGRTALIPLQTEG